MDPIKPKFGLGGLLTLGGVAALFATPTPAEAHVCMDFPISRVGVECTSRSPQKEGPCPVPRGDEVAVFKPGETITVRLRETVNHPSHFRIAFDPDGEDFRDPVAVDDTVNNYPNILVDGIEDAEEAVQEVQITFPDQATENGVLQLIQVMYDKGDNGFGGNSGGPDANNDLYYSCADIALRSGDAPTAAVETADPNAVDGGTRAAAVAVPIALLLLGAGFARRTRTRRDDTV